MSADLLRRAAALMRQRAQAATPGPWVQGKPIDAIITQAYPVTDATYRGYYGGFLVGESIVAGDRAHIASWHPAVAVAVADWLTWVAGSTLIEGSNRHGYQQALAVARAYLGEEEGGDQS